MSEHWDKFKENAACIKCGNAHGVLYEMLGRDPVFIMYCEECKTGFSFNFSEEEVETDFFDGNEDFYPGMNIPKYNMSFSEVLQSMERLGISV